LSEISVIYGIHLNEISCISKLGYPAELPLIFVVNFNIGFAMLDVTLTVCDIIGCSALTPNSYSTVEFGIKVTPSYKLAVICGK